MRMNARAWVFIRMNALSPCAQAARAEFVATKGTDVARGFFEWSPLSPIFFAITDGARNGKTLWQIAGGPR